MRVMITGVAGFIGSTLAMRLLERGDHVYGIDNMNDYYDVTLKEARLARFKDHDNFSFERLDIADRKGMERLFERHRFDAVMNLAAQAGVRYSIENPASYVDANLVGFANILEGCRHSKVGHLVFASSSSVYGANTKLPFSEHDNVDHPVSLYAATKKANELMAHSYAHLYGLACTGLRFFTVYGPWGRPDMALFKFTKGILEGTPIPVFNKGEMIRDFTYIDDIVEGVIRVIDNAPKPDPNWSGEDPDPATSYAPYRVFNIGNNNPVQLMRYIEVLEECLGKKANMDLMPMQPGDVTATSADTTALHDAVGFKPDTTIETGIANFVEWYRDYYSARLRRQIRVHSQAARSRGACFGSADWHGPASDMSVLVTGGDGIYRATAVKRFGDRGKRVRVTTRRARPVQAGGGAESRASTLNTEWSHALAGVQSVVHLAARVHVMRDRSAEPLRDFREVNTDGTANLAEQAARQACAVRLSEHRQGQRRVHCGSAVS